MSTFTALRADLIKQQKLFVDPDFPPSRSSLFFDGAGKPRDIQWKRPGELVQKPKFIVDRVSRFDLDQGQLGNCWFVAAASTLASSHRKQFLLVCPQDQSFDRNYAGIFRFNFWWYGKWREVIVDDYLPCDQWGLLYCRNKEERTEFWAALMEKAYAKLYGCYDALDGGKLNDALVDFTGGISELISLEDKSKVIPNLYKILFKTSRMNSMIGAAIYLGLPTNSRTTREVQKPNGLYMGHAYSVTGFATIQTASHKIRLLRLRNPWGRGEWVGPWSDRSRELAALSEEQKQQMGIVIRDDGEFWIAQQDFIDHFDEVAICHLQPDALTQEVAIDMNRRQWAVSVYHDSWIRGVTAGGCGNPPNQKLYWSNPQFHVTLTEHDDDDEQSGDCTLIVSLMEKEYDSRKKIAIGYDIYRLHSGYPEPLDGEKASSKALRLATRSGNFRYDREVTNRFVLPPGVYVIIPSTYQPHKESDFMIRYYTEKKASAGVLDVNTGPAVVVKPPADFVQDLFNKYSGPDGKMDSSELLAMLNEVFSKNGSKMNFNLETCRCIQMMMDTNKSGFLNITEVREMYKQIKAYRDVFQQFDKDRSGSVDSFELSAMFKTMGFPVSRSVVTSIVRRYAGRHHLISEEDFIMILCKLTTMYHIYIDQRRSLGVSSEATPFTLDEWLKGTMFC